MSKPTESPEFSAIPDELLPEGVSGATWDPVVLRAHAEMYCRHRFDHNMEIKAWVVLHLLNEYERLQELP